MNARSSLAALAAGALLAALPAGALAAPKIVAAPKTITPKGVGAVKLGASYASLRAKKLIGPIRPGCELGGPSTRSASLRPPLKGFVDFTLTSPRKVANISISGGATARGVGVGSTSAALKAAFPYAKFDPTSEDVFQLTFVRVGPKGGGPLHFAVTLDTKKVSVIGIPVLAVCE